MGKFSAEVTWYCASDFNEAFPISTRWQFGSEKKKKKVSESPSMFLKEVRNHKWQIQAGIARTARCTSLMDDLSIAVTDTYPNYLVSRGSSV